MPVSPAGHPFHQQVGPGFNPVEFNQTIAQVTCQMDAYDDAAGKHVHFKKIIQIILDSV